MICLGIVNTEESLYSGKVDRISAPGIEGDFEITPGHNALISLLRPGAIIGHLSNSIDPIVVYVGSGIIEVQPDHVWVLADSAFHAREEHEATLLEQQKDKRLQISENTSQINHMALLKELAQTTAQLQAIKQLRRYRKRNIG